MPDTHAPIVASPERVHAALATTRRALRARDELLVQTQVDIARIAAPTGDEQERGDWIAERLLALGLGDVRRDAVGNVIGRRAGYDRRYAAAPVVLCAHLDTVFPRDVPLNVRRVGARWVGPGIGDNSRGLAGLLAIAEALRELRTLRPVEFVATVGEEGHGDLRGAKHYFRENARPAAVIVVDSPGDDRVVHRALGVRRFHVAFCGPGGHSWTAFGVPNAIHAAARCAARLAALDLPTSPRAALTVSRIGGGLAVNVIPSEAWLEVDIRSTDATQLDDLSRHVHAAARAAAAEENARRAANAPPLTFVITATGDRPPGAVAADDPLVRAAIAATQLVGRSPELSVASTDANVPIALGIPTVAIGAGGRGGEAHTVDEWFENVEGTRGIARALTLTVAAAGLA